MANSEKEPFFAPERVATGRIRELDYAKGLCIIGLVLVHIWCFAYTGDESNSAVLETINYVANPIGAPLFMFCMGMGVVLSTHQSAQSNLIRGIALLTFGQLLNIVRQGLMFGVAGFVIDPLAWTCLIFVFSSDIMQFAGLAFLLLALLKKLNVKPIGLIAVGVVLNIAGMLLCNVNTGCYPLDHFLGFFWGNRTGGSFPVLNWFIFVACGYVYGMYYVRAISLKRWYKIVLPLGIVLTAIYYLLMLLPQTKGSFGVINMESDLAYCYITLPNAIGCIICSITFIGILWAIGLAANIKPLTYFSRHINKYYCISYVCIGLLALISFTGLFEIGSDLALIISTIAILLLCTGIIMLTQKPWGKRVGAFLLTEHRTVFFVAIWVVSLAFVLVGYYFCGQYNVEPCFMTQIEDTLTAVGLW